MSIFIYLDNNLHKHIFYIHAKDYKYAIKV